MKKEQVIRKGQAAKAQAVVCDAPKEQKFGESPAGLIKYLIVGILFGIVFVKAEIISWFRIQEMFRLQSFFMYGVIGSAILVGIVSVQLNE